jgi:hypothetical protein
LTEEEEGNAPKGPPRTKHEVLHAPLLPSHVPPLRTHVVCCGRWIRRRWTWTWWTWATRWSLTSTPATSPGSPPPLRHPLRRPLLRRRRQAQGH